MSLPGARGWRGRPMFRGLRHWRVLRLLRTMHPRSEVTRGYLPCHWHHVGRADDVSRDLASGCAAGAVFEHLVANDTIGRGDAALYGFAIAFPCRPANGLPALFRAVGGWNLLRPALAMMIFRIGHARAPSVHTMRQSVESIACCRAVWFG